MTAAKGPNGRCWWVLGALWGVIGACQVQMARDVEKEGAEREKHLLNERFEDICADAAREVRDAQAAW